MTEKARLLRITTVPISLAILLRGQLNFFQNQGFEILAVSADGPEVLELTRSGIAHEVVPMTRKITPFSDLVSLIRLVRVIRKFKPHIVHTHTPKAGLLGMLAAWLCRVPVRMHTVAGLPLMEAKGIKRKLLILTEKITYRCATLVLPNSDGLQQFISSHIQSGNKFRIVAKGSSNGIDIAHFNRTAPLEDQAREVRKNYGITGSDIVFSFVGRVVNDKGISELVRAFRSITQSQTIKPFLLIIGSFEQDLDPLNQEDYDFLHSNSNVILAGFQKDVRPWLIASDIFVFPSYREGFPNVVMQACCLQIPCVVSNINGCNEIIKNNETGLIVPVKDATALEQAMKRLMADLPARNQMASNAKQYVSANFNQQYVWKELLTIYQQQMANER